MFIATSTLIRGEKLGECHMNEFLRKVVQSSFNDWNTGGMKPITAQECGPLEVEETSLEREHHLPIIKQ